MSGLPRLGLAIAFADARVFLPASAQDIKTVQARRRPKRKLAILQLTVLSEMNLLVDPTKVEAILPGRGGIDEAQDGVSSSGSSANECFHFTSQHFMLGAPDKADRAGQGDASGPRREDEGVRMHVEVLATQARAASPQAGDGSIC